MPRKKLRPAPPPALLERLQDAWAEWEYRPSAPREAGHLVTVVREVCDLMGIHSTVLRRAVAARRRGGASCASAVEAAVVEVRGAGS